MNYTVAKIKSAVAKEYIKNNHYSRGSHNGPSPCYGLFSGQDMIGVLMFATPCSENVRSSVFGAEMKDSVIELHRLHILDVTPKNTESWFISRCLRLLKKDKPKVKGVLSFADTTEGHTGTIYQACNFLRCGDTGGGGVFYRDASGRLRHPRQNGKNISRKEAEELGWNPVRREKKIRYLYLLPKSRAEKKTLSGKLKLKVSAP